MTEFQQNNYEQTVSPLGKFLPQMAIKKPVSVTMTLLAILVVGLVAYTLIPINLFPEGFVNPYLGIWIPYRNSNPQEVEEQITKPVEEMLQTVRNIRRMRSSSSSNGCNVFLVFRQNTDMDLAYMQVQDRLERIRPEFPNDIERFFLWKQDMEAMPIFYFSISLDRAFDDVYAHMEEHVQRPVQRIDGVANVEMWGARKKMILIDVNQQKVDAYGVSMYQLIQQLQRDNFTLTSGYIETGSRKMFIRSLGRFSSLEEIENIWVKGATVRLKDVALVRYDLPVYRGFNRINRKPAMGVAVYKESTANIVDVTRRIKDVLEREIRMNPALRGVEIHPQFDQGFFIQGAIDNLKDSALWGGCFAFFVLFFFLRRFRMSLIIITAIPLSLVVTLIVIYFTGWSLNVITMMGMLISIGLVVDNSIVIVENIYRLRIKGYSSRKAAVMGAGEVGLAITTATLTTVVVFLPLILMNDDTNFRFFMIRIGLPVICALIGSLIVALVFIPFGAIHLAKAKPLVESQFIAASKQLYKKLLQWTLTHRWDAVIIMLLLLASISFPVNNLKKGDSHGGIGQFWLNLEFPEHFSSDDSRKIIERIEDFIYERKQEYNVKALQARVWGVRGSIQAYGDQEVNPWWYATYRSIRKVLGVPMTTVLTHQEIIEDLKKNLPDFPGVKVRMEWSGSGNEDASVSVRLYGDDTTVLTRLSEEVERRLKAVPSIVSIETDTDRGSDEVRVSLNRQIAGKYGVSPQTFAGTIAYAFRGLDLPDYRSQDREIDVRVQLQEEDRETLDQLKNLKVFSAGGKSVPVSTIANFQIDKGFGQIHRRDGKSFLRIIGKTTEKDLKKVYRQIDNAMTGFEMPYGYEWDKGGRYAEFEEQDEAMIFGVILSITFVFLLMGVLFESFIIPLSIIFCIPFSFFGVYWLFYLTGTTFDIMAGMGLIILIGIVVNNAIVLVDLVTRLRGQGMSRREALIEAGQNRFRPILLTAFTTMFSLVPMALGEAGLFDISYAPLGRAIIGGLLTSTFFTLLVVPLSYTFFDDLRMFWESILTRIFAKQEIPQVETTP